MYRERGGVEERGERREEGGQRRDDDETRKEKADDEKRRKEKELGRFRGELMASLSNQSYLYEVLGLFTDFVLGWLGTSLSPQSRFRRSICWLTAGRIGEEVGRIEGLSLTILTHSNPFQPIITHSNPFVPPSYLLLPPL